MDDESEVSDIGLHYCYCSKFLFVLTNKHFLLSDKLFRCEQKKMLTKYTILLMVVFWCSSEFSYPITS